MPTRARSSRRLPGIALFTALFAVALPACTPSPGVGQPAPMVTVGAPSPAPSRPGAETSTPVSVDEVTAFAGQQLRATSEQLGVDQYPVTTDAAGAWTTKDATAWTSGFLPGSFWQLHELTGEPAWAEKARAWQAGVATQRTRTDTHDLGFMLMFSVGNDARVTGDPAARPSWREPHPSPPGTTPPSGSSGRTGTGRLGT